MEKLKKKVNRRKKDKTDLIIQQLAQKNCTLSETTIIPIHQRDYVYFYCENHKEYGEQKVREDSLVSNKFYCKKCQAEHMSILHSGSNSPSWKGGTTTLRHAVRGVLTEWVSLTLKAFDYTCFLTGRKDDLEVHHIVGFDTILNNIAFDMGIDIYKNVSSISDSELKELCNRVLEFHMFNDIGVVLNKDIHMEFHRIYGLGDNTPEQFYEFCKSYNKHVTSRDISDFSLNNVTLDKKIGSSKFLGVYKNSNNRWESVISFHGKQIRIGSFLTQFRAAKAYNEKAIELFGDNARINNLSDMSDYWVYEDSYYHFKNKGTSVYTGVNFSGGGWRYEIWEDNVGKIYSGSAKTELQSAYLYNLKKKELLGEDSIVNFLTFEEEQEAKESLRFNYEYYEHKKNGKTIYTNIDKANNKWGIRFRLNGKFTSFDYKYPTDKEAAIAYNNYVLSNNLKKKLNKIV